MSGLIKTTLSRRLCVICEPGSEVIVTSDQYAKIKEHTQPEFTIAQEGAQETEEKKKKRSKK